MWRPRAQEQRTFIARCLKLRGFIRTDNGRIGSRSLLGTDRSFVRAPDPVLAHRARVLETGLLTLRLATDREYVCCRAREPRDHVRPQSLEPALLRRAAGQGHGRRAASGFAVPAADRRLSRDVCRRDVGADDAAADLAGLR